MKTKLTISDLEKIRNKVQNEGEQPGTFVKEKILVCMGGGCLASGSQKIKEGFEKAIQRNNLDNSISIVGTGCLGPCSHGPVVLMTRDKVLYQNVSPDDVDEIVEEHIRSNKIVERLAFREDSDSKPI